MPVTDRAGWRAALADDGYVLDGDATERAPGPDAHPAQAWVAPLTSLGVARVSGPDARSFLHAQLTNDIQTLAAGSACLAAWCDPRGRAQVLFRVGALDDSTLLLLAPAATLDAVLGRLELYKLRARASVERLDDAWGCLGVSGTDGATPGTVIALDESWAIGVANGRHIVTGPLAAIEARRGELRAAGQAAAGENAWRLAEVRAGIGQVHAATIGEFVPQMLNLELTGGVSFAKGCYPGQEIVARAQYLGRIKRRMYRLATAAPARPGDAVLGIDGARAGTVVEAAATADGDTELLAVLRIEQADSPQALRVGGDATLALRPLPYALAPAPPATA